MGKFGLRAAVIGLGLAFTACSGGDEFSVADYFKDLPATEECQTFKAHVIEGFNEWGSLSLDDKGNPYNPDMTINERSHLAADHAICAISGVLHERLDQ